MLKFSLTTSKKGQKIIRIHHDFGDFKFYLMPDEKNPNAYSWASHPKLMDPQAGDFIAREAAKSIAEFTGNEAEKLSFKEMVVALRQAERIAQ